MTTEEIIQAREWTAQFMGYSIDNPEAPDWLWRFTNGLWVDDWHPEEYLNQTFLVINRMKELGWHLYIEPEPNLTFPNREEGEIVYEIGFYHPENMKLEIKPCRGFCMAEKVDAKSILKAAMAAMPEV